MKRMRWIRNVAFTTLMLCLAMPSLLGAMACYELPFQWNDRCETDYHDNFCTPNDIDPFDYFCYGAGIDDGQLEGTCSDFCGFGNVTWGASWCDSGAEYPFGLDMTCIDDFYIHCECTEV